MNTTTNIDADAIELRYFSLLSRDPQEWQGLADQLDACATDLRCVAAAERAAELRGKAEECRAHAAWLVGRG